MEGKGEQDNDRLDLFSLGKVKASKTLQSHLNPSSLFPLTFASYKMRKYTMLRVCFLLLISWWDPQHAPCYGCIFSYKTHQSKLWVPPTCKKERNMHPVMGVFSPTKLTNPNQKLPLLVYFHGGVCSPFTSKYYKLHGVGSPPVIISPVFSCFYTNERHVTSNKS